MIRTKAISMRLTNEGVLVEGSHGFVLLQQEDNEITATAMGQRSKRIPGYAQELRDEAIRRASQYTRPWQRRSDGSIQINDHSAFYEGSFNPSLRCLEMLREWLQASER